MSKTYSTNPPKNFGISQFSFNAGEVGLNYVYDDLGREVEMFTATASAPTTPVDDFKYTYDTLGELASVSVVERNGIDLTTSETTTYGPFQ